MSAVRVTPALPAYSFLSQPPPQKKRPAQPLPSLPSSVPCAARRRSATISAITAWVATVQPGSPAQDSPPPYSPPRTSCARRRSVSRSRQSAGSPRIASASFLNFFDTPTTASIARITPSVKEFQHDVTAVGYASVFIRLPTPVSPVPSVPEKPQTPAKPSRTLKRFRSLGALKPSRKSSKTTSADMPSLPLSNKASREQATSSKSKKSQYPKYRPAPLAAELAMAQFADGGKMDHHIRRFAEAQARAGGATMVDGKLVGVGDVWRDGNGGVWRDEDEEWEYAHLLGGDEALNESGWVRFGSMSGAAEGERRGSTGSVDSADSDLDPRYAMHAETERDDLAVFGGAVHPSALRKPGMSVLALPSRSCRSAKHLRKPEFLLDVFPVPDESAHAGAQAKARKRPAPLNLAPPSPAFKCPTNPLDADQVRKDFIDSSFTPPPQSRSATQHRSAAPRPADTRVAAPQSLKAPPKTPKMDVRNLLRAMGGRKGGATDM